MRQQSGVVAEPEWTVEASTRRLADGIGLSVATAKTTVGGLLCQEYRSPKTASYTVHRA
ncbi:hypothetical protein ABZ016_24905 [Streptomyces sp. NPDC006372]|uniref:hypothetical protein n=1 Tax=Streptomyces sp. NPDC006372 TaxID=3155599 RepID=UPI0033BF7D52